MWDNVEKAIEQHGESIDATIRRVLRRRIDLFEECRQHILVDRLPRILELHDVGRRRTILNNVRGYTYKWYVKELKRRRKIEPIRDRAIVQQPPTSEVRILYEDELLNMRFVQDMSYGEIGEALGCAASTVMRRLQHRLQELRSLGEIQSLLDDHVKHD